MGDRSGRPRNEDNGSWWGKVKIFCFYPRFLGGRKEIRQVKDEKLYIFNIYLTVVEDAHMQNLQVRSEFRIWSGLKNENSSLYNQMASLPEVEQC